MYFQSSNPVILNKSFAKPSHLGNVQLSSIQEIPEQNNVVTEIRICFIDPLLKDGGYIESGPHIHISQINEVIPGQEKPLSINLMTAQLPRIAKLAGQKFRLRTDGNNHGPNIYKDPKP
jgi:hypothetical protein